MALIRRHVPEGSQASREHSLGGMVVTFNDQDEAEVDDPAALETCAAFPETFEVVGTGADAPGAPPAPSVVNDAALEPLTVAELQDIATGLGLVNVRHMRKAELIDAILTQQRLMGGH